MTILKPMPHVAKQIQICKNTALTDKSRMKQRHHDTMGILYTEPMPDDGLFPSASFVYLELQKLAQGFEDLRQVANVFQTYLNVLRGENTTLSSNMYENLKLEIRYYIQKMYQNIPDQAKRLEQWYDMISRFEKMSEQNLEKTFFEKEISHIEILWKAESRLLEQQIYEKWNQLLPMNQEKFRVNHIVEKNHTDSNVREIQNTDRFNRVKNLIQKEIQREFSKIEYFCNTKDASLSLETYENKRISQKSNVTENYFEKAQIVNQQTEEDVNINSETVSSEFTRYEFDSSEIEQYLAYLDADEWMTTIKQLASEADLPVNEAGLPVNDVLTEKNTETFSETLADKLTDVNMQVLKVERETAYGTEFETEDATLKLLQIRDHFLQDFQAFEPEEKKQLFIRMVQNTEVTTIAKQMGFDWTSEMMQGGRYDESNISNISRDIETQRLEHLQTRTESDIQIYDRHASMEMDEKTAMRNDADREEPLTIGEDPADTDYMENVLKADFELTLDQQIKLLQKRDEFLTQVSKFSETEQRELIQTLKELTYVKNLTEFSGIDWEREFEENKETFLTNLDAEEWLHITSELRQSVSHLYTDKLQKVVYNAYDEANTILKETKINIENERHPQIAAVKKEKTLKDDAADASEILAAEFKRQTASLDGADSFAIDTIETEETNIESYVEFKTCIEYLERRMEAEQSNEKLTVSTELKEYYRNLQEQVSDKIFRELENVVKRYYISENSSIEETISKMNQQEKAQLITLLKKERVHNQILENNDSLTVEQVANQMREYAENRMSGQKENLTAEQVKNQIREYSENQMSEHTENLTVEYAENQASEHTENLAVEYAENLTSEHTHNISVDTEKIVNAENIENIEKIEELYHTLPLEEWIHVLVYLGEHAEEIQSAEFSHMIKTEYERLNSVLSETYSQFGILPENPVEEYEKLETYKKIQDAKFEFLKQKENSIQDQKFTSTELIKDIVRRELQTEKTKDQIHQHEANIELKTELRKEQKEVQTELQNSLRSEYRDELKTGVSEELQMEQLRKIQLTEEGKVRFQGRHEAEVEEEFEKSYEILRNSIRVSDVLDAPALEEWIKSSETKFEFLKQKENFIQELKQDITDTTNQVKDSELTDADLKIWIEYLENRSISHDFEGKVISSANLQIRKAGITSISDNAQINKIDNISLSTDYQKIGTDNISSSMDYQINSIEDLSSLERAKIYYQDTISSSAELKKDYYELQEQLTEKIWKDLGQIVEKYYQDMPFAVKEESNLLHTVQTAQKENIKQTTNLSQTLNILQKEQILQKEYANDTKEISIQTGSPVNLAYLNSFHTNSETIEHNFDMQEEYSVSYDSLRMPSMVMTRPQPPSFKNMPKNWRDDIGQQIELKTEEVIQKKSIQILESSENTMPVADIRQTVQSSTAQAWKEKTENLEKKIKVQENLLKELQEKQVHLQSDEMMKKIVENTLKEMHRELKIERMRRGLR